jgi:hypothetical protein
MICPFVAMGLCESWDLLSWVKCAVGRCSGGPSGYGGSTRGASCVTYGCVVPLEGVSCRSGPPEGVFGGFVGGKEQFDHEFIEGDVLGRAERGESGEQRQLLSAEVQVAGDDKVLRSRLHPCFALRGTDSLHVWVLVDLVTKLDQDRVGVHRDHAVEFAKQVRPPLIEVGSDRGEAFGMETDSEQIHGGFAHPLRNDRQHPPRRFVGFDHVPVTVKHDSRIGVMRRQEAAHGRGDHNH